MVSADLPPRELHYEIHLLTPGVELLPPPPHLKVGGMPCTVDVETMTLIARPPVDISNQAAARQQLEVAFDEWALEIEIERGVASAPWGTSIPRALPRLR
jgi:hypothetical protein